MHGIACPAYMCTHTGVNENDTRATERYEHELLLSVMWTHSVSDVTASLLSLSPIVLYTAVLQAKDLKLKGISKAHTYVHTVAYNLSVRTSASYFMTTDQLEGSRGKSCFVHKLCNAFFQVVNVREV